MNPLESILFDASTVEVVSNTSYKYGAYFMMRHNTADADVITNQLPKIYNNVFKSLNSNSHPTKTKTTPRIPLEKNLVESIKLRAPMMISTLELQKTDKSETIISHHFVYGLHWHLMTDVDDQSFDTKLDEYTRRLDTVDSNGNVFLLQPVGVDAEQALDRNNDETIISFMRYAEIIESQPDVEDLSELPQDNLIMMFNKLRHPSGIRYALHYSYAV